MLSPLRSRSSHAMSCHAMARDEFCEVGRGRASPFQWCQSLAGSVFRTRWHSICFLAWTLNAMLVNYMCCTELLYFLQIWLPIMNRDGRKLIVFVHDSGGWQRFTTCASESEDWDVSATAGFLRMLRTRNWMVKTKILQLLFGMWSSRVADEYFFWGIIVTHSHNNTGHISKLFTSLY